MNPNTDLPKYNQHHQQKVFISRKHVIFGTIIASLMIIIIILSLAIINKKSPEINNTNLFPTLTPKVTEPATPIVKATNSFSSTPGQINYGQMKDLVNLTQSKTIWSSPTPENFDWISNCDDSTTVKANSLKGTLIETTIDYTKPGAKTISDEIQNYFNLSPWKLDNCNVADSTIKQLRGYVNGNTGFRVLIIYTSNYKDISNPSYPPSGTKVSENITIYYE